jgi:hypothetical protein
MPRGKKTLQPACLSIVREARIEANPSNPERTAALAAMSLSQQSPGLVLPRLGGVPTSYSLTQGDDTAFVLADNLTKLGLGSIEIWNRVNGNPTLFVRESINAWLGSIGAEKLTDVANFYFGITGEIDVIEAADEPRVFGLIEVEECGAIQVGRLLDALEAEEAGLGAAFYMVLMRSLNHWARTYDMHEAEMWLDYLREGIESEADPDSNLTLEQQCEAQGITLPDLDRDIPAYIPRGYGSKKRDGFMSLLKKHRTGRHGAIVQRVLTMAAIKPRSTHPLFQKEQYWDDQPLPSWLVFFRRGDTITQAFDEAASSMHESSHEPTWITAFNPSDVKALRTTLEEVEKFVRLNLDMMELVKECERLEKQHASIGQRRIDNQLLAA